MDARTIFHLRLTRPPMALYGEVFTVLHDITPAVQALPPDSAVLDVTGALRYFHRDAEGLADLLATRVLARYGLAAAIGAGATRSQWVRRFLRQIQSEVAGQLPLEPARVRRVRAGSAVGRGLPDTGRARGERGAAVATTVDGRWPR